MSNNINTELLERASDMIDYWEGTLHAELIEYAIDINDLELVHDYVLKAEAEASRQELYGYDVI